MTFVTPEPYIGHLGLDGVGDTKSLLESELRNRTIKWVTNAKTTRFAPGAIAFDELRESGDPVPHELPFKFGMMLPAFRGIKPLQGIDGLVNPRGFVLVDEFQRSRKFPQRLRAGVCIAIPPRCTGPPRAPKTGFMIESMVDRDRAQHQCRARWRSTADRQGKVERGVPRRHRRRRVAFVAQPQIPPRNVDWLQRGPGFTSRRSASRSTSSTR